MPRFRAACLATTALFVTLGVSACKKPEAAAADVRTRDRIVLVASVEAAEDADPAFTGVIAARVQSDLGFRVPGKVTARLVDTGQMVKAGQALMRIDATDYTHAITAQTGEVEAARARYIQAAADEKRYRGLIGTGAISRTVYDQAKAAADSASALLSAAQAQEKVARNQGGYATLLADADGTVVETLAEPGQVVTAGQTVIRLAHAGPREASVYLPETARPVLGSAAQATLYGGKITVTAHLRQLADAADPLTRTYEARYVLDGAGAHAPLGATVTLQMLGARPDAAVQVPLGALDDEGHGPGVWAIDPDSSRVAFRPVSVASLGGATAILSGGAPPGLRIVAAGGHFLHDGQRVQMASEQAAMQ
jgi:RND family efflux transporter MFP subunit